MTKKVRSYNLVENPRHRGIFKKKMEGAEHKTRGKLFC